MITPILVDLALNVIAFLFGLYVLSCKMGAFNRAIYTPRAETLTIAAFMLAWSIFGFKAFAVISRYPPWLSDNNGWQGAWSYTLGRAVLVVAFVVVTCIFSKRAAAQRRERNQNKQHAP